MNETMKSILDRRSTRAYFPVQIADDARDALVEAGLWAPTARNAQEIKIACVQDMETMVDVLTELVRAR